MWCEFAELYLGTAKPVVGKNDEDEAQKCGLVMTVMASADSGNNTSRQGTGVSRKLCLVNTHMIP